MILARAILLVATTACCVSAQSKFYLKDGDRVVFYGDSITDQRLYTTYAETFVVTRFPDMKVTFVHSGWGGDRVSGGGGGPIDLRIKRDILAYKPTVLTIMLGMNDAGYRPLDSALLNTYERGYEYILDTVQGAIPHLRVTAIQPSPYDDVTRPPLFEGGYNAVLLKYAKFVKDVATNIRVDTADLNTPVVAALKKANEIDPEGAKKLIGDRVHPGDAGHMLLAEALLKAWHAPALVSDVELSAKTNKVTRADNAEVTEWNGAAWTVTEKALPMPIGWNDPGAVLVIKASDYVEALDQETLRVTGLKKGNWQLKIDGSAIATFSSEDLDQGVNLARYNTPMMQQALTVHAYTQKHANVHNVRWRDIQVPLAGDDAPSKDAVMKSLDQLEDELVDLQRKAAHPVPHKFELTPQS